MSNQKINLKMADYARRDPRSVAAQLRGIGDVRAAANDAAQPKWRSLMIGNGLSDLAVMVMLFVAVGAGVAFGVI